MMKMKIEGWPTLLKERNRRVNKWWRIDVSALREEMKLSSWGDCLTRAQTPKILMKMKAACACIHMSASMSAFLDFQQGEFGGSGQTYFDWEVEQTTVAESHIRSDAESCYVPGEMFIVLWRFATLVKRVGFFVMLWLNKATVIQIQLCPIQTIPNNRFQVFWTALSTAAPFLNSPQAAGSNGMFMLVAIRGMLGNLALMYFSSSSGPVFQTSLNAVERRMKRLKEASSRSIEM